jgi:hypothetical protein
MLFEPREYLRHILAEADYLLESSKGLSRERFLDDETLSDQRPAFNITSPAAQSLRIISDLVLQGLYAEAMQHEDAGESIKGSGSRPLL